MEGDDEESEVLAVVVASVLEICDVWLLVVGAAAMFSLAATDDAEELVEIDAAEPTDIPTVLDVLLDVWLVLRIPPVIWLVLRLLLRAEEEAMEDEEVMGVDEEAEDVLETLTLLPAELVGV